MENAWQEKPDLVVVVLVDLDDRDDCVAFKNELVGIIELSAIKTPHSLFLHCY